MIRLFAFTMLGIVTFSTCVSNISSHERPGVVICAADHDVK